MKCRFRMGFRNAASWIFAVSAAMALAATPSMGDAASAAQVRDVARELACLCGDCPTRPLDECTCGFAGQKRSEIAEHLDRGEDKETVIAAFVARYGTQVLVVPPARGFNLSAWVMPFIVLFGGGLAVRSVIRRWAQDRSRRPAANRATIQAPPTDDPYRERLESELRDRDV